MSDVPLASEVPGPVSIEDADDGVRCGSSGCQWLLSLFTLGGAALATSLYLGVLTGVCLLWLPTLAMVLGVIMLGAIVYVTRNTGQRPLRAINRHINPVLGWGWALAALAANMVWCLPQYSLASGVLQQNLMPNYLGEGSQLGAAVGTRFFNLLPGLQGPETDVGDFGGKIVIAAAILLLTLIVTWTYDVGGWVIKLYELLLKLVVAGIVACFVGVVCVVSYSGKLNWSEVCWGFVPDLTRLWKPADSFNWLLDAVPPAYHRFWHDMIVDKQHDVMISAAATAVGVNMTFLLPYLMLRRGRDKESRGLVWFGPCTGMFIPFVLATSCVVMASATQFHPLPADFDLPRLQKVAAEIPEEVLQDIHEARRKYMFGEDQYKILSGTEGAFPSAENAAGHDDPLKPAELMLASHLQTRDARALSASLQPLTGRVVADYVFGIGVVGMTLLSITLLMLISGFVICEIFGLPAKGWANRLGCLAATTGVLGPFLWTQHARFWLVVPTSVFCFTLLPFAYVTFLLMMNSRSLLGDQMPRGVRRVAWNIGLGIAAAVATGAGVYVVWLKTKGPSIKCIGNQYGGLGIIAALVLLVLVVHFVFPRKPKTEDK